MGKPTYYELLRHPNWQKKRLEVMDAAKFQCVNCGSRDITLNIHHTYYERGKKPWEYPTNSLRCLCEDCHKTEHATRDAVKKIIGGMEPYDIDRMLGFAAAYAARHDDQDRPILVQSYEFAEGVACVFGTNAGFIIYHLKDGVIDCRTIDAKLDEWRAFKEGR